MKFLSFLVLFGLFNASLSSAQSITLTSGKVLQYATYINDISLKNGNVLALCSHGAKFGSWQISGTSLEPIGAYNLVSESGGNKKLPNIVNSSEYTYVSTLSFKHKTIIVYLKYQKEDKSKILYYYTLDENGKTDGKLTKLPFNKIKEFDNVYLRENIEADAIILSRTKVKLNAKKTEYEAEDETEFTWFDSNFNEKTTVNYNTGVSGFLAGCIITKSGFVYNLIKVVYNDEETKKLKKERKSTWHYRIMGFNILDPNAKPFEKDVDFKDKSMVTAKLTYTDTKELVIAGSYSDLIANGDEFLVDGVYACKADANDGEVTNLNFSKLSGKALECFNHKGSTTYYGGDNLKYYLNVIEVVKLDNNSFDIVFEETFNDWNVARNECNAILVANVSSSLAFNWSSVIYKKQAYVANKVNSNSFIYKKDGNDLRILFVDIDRNYDSKTLQPKAETFKDVKRFELGNAIAQAIVDEKGAVKQRLLVEESSTKLMLSRAVWNDAKTEFFVPAFKGDNSCIVKVQVQ